MLVERADRSGAQNRGTGRPSASAAALPVPARRRLPAAAFRLLLIIVAAALIAGGTLWWRHERGGVTTYRTTAVTRGAVTRTVVATGTVNPQLTIIVGSYVSGVIRNMYCDYNTQVRKGQLCAKIDPRPYQAALDQARGQLARDSAQLAGARHDLDRYAILWGQNSVSKQTYDDQDALVKELEGTVQLDRAAVETAQVNLGYTDIVSPVNGTVVARNITIGQTVAASFQTPTLFLIATDLTKMQVDTNVSESDIGAIREGEPAGFTVEAFTDRSFQGTVAQVRQAPQTVQNVVTYDVVVDADNAQFLLKPGMTATVQIVSAQRTNALRVPDQALRFTPGGVHALSSDSAPIGVIAPQVWVLRAGQPSAVPVRTGLDDDSYTEVTGGDLQPGDQVIIGEQRDGASRHNAGAPVRFGL